MQRIHHRSGVGSSTSIELEILAETNPPFDKEDEELRKVIHRVGSELEAALLKSATKDDPARLARRVAERAEIVGLFKEPIFVEEIPNRYCSEWCCSHLPWFLITTKIGVFEIGWRKRVLVVDWSGTVGTKTSQLLFPGQDVTKGDKYIHAWSMELAQQYVNIIMEDAAGLKVYM